MSRSLRAILAIACFLVERNCAIHITIDSVTSIHSVESLGIICPQAKVVDVLCKAIYVIVLCISLDDS